MHVEATKEVVNLTIHAVRCHYQKQLHFQRIYIIHQRIQYHIRLFHIITISYHTHITEHTTIYVKNTRRDRMFNIFIDNSIIQFISSNINFKHTETPLK